MIPSCALLLSSLLSAAAASSALPSLLLLLLLLLLLPLLLLLLLAWRLRLRFRIRICANILFAGVRKKKEQLLAMRCCPEDLQGQTGLATCTYLVAMSGHDFKMKQ